MTSKTAKTNANKTFPPLSPIAIIGLSGILPKAENIDQYWSNIMDEVNCITEVPPSRWSIDDYYDPDPSTPDKTYNKHGGFIPDIKFDPMEFGLPPNLLEVTDVSQLLSLIVAKNALIDAGYIDDSKTILDRTGVILGMVGMSSKVIQPLLNRLQYPVWEKVLRSSSLPEKEIPETIEKMKLAYIQWNENAFPGAIGNVVAGRIANRFDLGGTNCIVDAACASSLAAVSMAVSELALGKADMMIAGGVDTDNSILTYLCFSKTPAFSKGANLRAFSAESDGMLTGEGIGMLVLKRLEDAERDNDHIYSVIRGIGSSSDGYYKSIYAPRPSGQAKAIRRAYQQANYDSSTVRLIEAHGTGTNAGDPAEFDGLIEAFSESGLFPQKIALGSVKSQIGHTKATAGAAGLIKVSLALHQQVLPATINVSEPHPAMKIESTPFYLNTETRPWFADTSGIPRRAGVSSFGFGGTNFHIALEEYTGKNQEIKRRLETPNTIVLFAENPDKLLISCHESLKALNDTDARNVLNQLESASSTVEIPTDKLRIGFVAESVENAIDKLGKCVQFLEEPDTPNTWSHPQGIYFRKSGVETTGKIVALFPGQGSQYINMGRELATNFPAMRAVFEQANKVFSKSSGESLTEIVYPVPVFNEEDRKKQSKRLTNTKNAQPAIGTFSIGLYQLLTNAGFQADHFAGHSFGELTALCVSGVYSDEAFTRLAIARGNAMSTPPSSDSDSGTMIAIKGNIEDLQKILEGQKEVTIANFNSPSQVVLAGATDSVEAMKDKLENANFSVYTLPVSAAFHTSFVKHAQAPFKKAIKKEAFNPPTKAVYSNSTAQLHDKDPKQIADNLTDHILNTVRFKEEIENIYQNGGTIFIEIGPKKILTNLVNDILKNAPHEVITLNPNPKGNCDLQFRQAVLQMRVLGIKLSDVDPLRNNKQLEPIKHSKVAVSLNGGFYTSKKTQDAFKQALELQPRNSHEDPSSNQKVVHQTVPASTNTYLQPLKPSEVGDQMIITGGSVSSQIKASQINNSNINVDALLEQFQDHQNGILKAHHLFLNNDNLSKKTIQGIAAEELNILSNNSDSPSPSDERKLSLLEKRLDFINQQQNGVSQAHQDFIQSQSKFTQQYAALIGQFASTNSSMQSVPLPLQKTSVEVSSPVKENRTQSLPKTIEPTASLPAQDISKTLYDQNQLTVSFLAIVSDKTGYPPDMLELEMDMEADLGIDSIKRVEILSAMQEQFPHLPTIEAEAMVDLRTLQQTIDAFSSTPNTLPQASSAETIHSDTPLDKTAPEIVGMSLANADLQSAFLNIVSDKTGYPPDMLELEMDMEADLGIDSIKRVEILSTMQEQFPHLPTIEAEAMVDLRTLQQTIDAFSSNSSALSQASPTETIHPETSPVTSAPGTSEGSPTNTDLQSAFLDIVSEKTGYPPDMLELEMDMEADLGIDSIKRVEILSAIQEQFPHLPTINAEELIELRTLDQIINRFSKGASSQSIIHESAPPIPESQPSEKEQGNIERQAVIVKELPKPDYLQFDIEENDLVLITDDGSDRSKKLAKHFTKMNIKVGMIHFENTLKGKTKSSQNGWNHYYISQPNESEVQSCMQNILNEYPGISAFIHLNPEMNGNKTDLITLSAENENILKSVFLIARHLGKPLLEVSDQGRSAFLAVTFMDGQLGLNGSKSSNPIPGGFSGLTKSLRLEWPSVFCRAIDIHPAIDADTVVEIIEGELHDPDLCLTEIGHTQQGRFTLATN